MAASLQSLCIGCAKHAPGPGGKLLATVCLAPYFVIYHTAVLVHARREIHMLFVLTGLLVNTGLGFAIKKVLKHPRPSATCANLGICHKHGMPSSHMQVMAFVVTTCLLLYWQRRRARKAGAGGPGEQQAGRHTASRRVQQAEILLCACLAAAVGYARVALGYHTAGQVLAGAAVGSAFALFWHMLTMVVARQHFGRIEALSASLGLWFRDTLAIQDVHQAEFEACAGAAAACKRKPE